MARCKTLDLPIEETASCQEASAVIGGGGFGIHIGQGGLGIHVGGQHLNHGGHYGRPATNWFASGHQSHRPGYFDQHSFPQHGIQQHGHSSFGAHGAHRTGHGSHGYR